MKFILNQNVSPKVAHALRELGHEVEVAPQAAPDKDILENAARSGAIVITCDEDFGALVFREGAPHSGVVKLSLRVNSAANQATALKNALRDGRISPGQFTKLSDSDLGKSSGD